MRAELIRGDARSLPLAAGSVHCVVTSPPYWGLRRYEGDAGMIGLEESLEAHLAALVAVFREVGRVLRDDGTLWLNYGDAYTSGGRKTSGEDHLQARAINEHRANGDRRPTPVGLKPKDLIGLPWRLAFALQADGWTLRRDIVWAKPNPIPESVTDRPTASHEFLFLLSKRARYFYDADAIREPYNEASVGRYETPMQSLVVQNHQPGRERVRENIEQAPHPLGANKRDVWSIASQPYKGAHFATFPEALVEPCIKAGTSERGVCGSCRAPWRRVVEVTQDGAAQGETLAEVRDDTIGGALTASWSSNTPNVTVERRHVGWAPTCTHEAEVVPATVLDPFVGSGTTCAVAQKLGRRGVGVELSGSYLGLARERLARAQAPLPLV